MGLALRLRLLRRGRRNDESLLHELQPQLSLLIFREMHLEMRQQSPLLAKHLVALGAGKQLRLGLVVNLGMGLQRGLVRKGCAADFAVEDDADVARFRQGPIQAAFGVRGRESMFPQLTRS